MSDSSQHTRGNTPSSQEDELERASALAVKEYLQANPQFFQQFPDLLDNIRIPHKRRGSVSLVEIQSEKLRQKNRILQHKLLTLIETAKQNEKIFYIYSELILSLLRCGDLLEVEDVLQEVFQTRLNMAAISLRPFCGANAMPELHRTFFKEKRFRTEPFFFGRLSQHEMQLLFKDQRYGSVALMKLGEQQDLGLMAIANNDDEHFHPDMDTMLLGLLQQFLSALLPTMLDG